jgi:hypothetical protein
VDWIIDLVSSPQFAGGVASGWVGRVIAVHLISRIKSDTIRKLFGRTWAEARSVFDDSYNAFVLEMVKAKSDGVVTDEERDMAKKAALAAAKKHLGWRMLVAHALKILGAKPEEWIAK